MIIGEEFFERANDQFDHMAAYIQGDLVLDSKEVERPLEKPRGIDRQLVVPS